MIKSFYVPKVEEKGRIRGFNEGLEKGREKARDEEREKYRIKNVDRVLKLL